MQYDEIIKRIDSLGKFGIHLGLGRIQKLLFNMGNPQDKLRFVHIAGTNGKGSTTTMIANILKQSGYRTGLFISPHVLCFEESMQINNVAITQEELTGCAEFVFEQFDHSAVDGEYPTQFEVVTAIALEWFYRRGCDIVCLEVGLGGRYDSTNVISAPLVQVITSIGIDHAAILGDTIAKIAYEKAGIIKGGTTVLYPLQEEDAVSEIQKQCELANSMLVMPDISQLTVTDEGFEANTFTYKGVAYQKGLRGGFQVYNAVTAITAAQELIKQGFEITETSIQDGVRAAFIPARMEVLSQNPLIVLDGAHNPDGGKVLAQSLAKLSPKKLTVLMGVLADKEYDAFLRIIQPYVFRFVAVTPHNPRALHAKDLCERARAMGMNAQYSGDIQDGVKTALRETDQNGALVICGSLYLAADVRKIVLEILNEKQPALSGSRQ